MWFNLHYMQAISHAGDGLQEIWKNKTAIIMTVNTGPNLWWPVLCSKHIVSIITLWQCDYQKLKEGLYIINYTNHNNLSTFYLLQSHNKITKPSTNLLESQSNGKQQFHLEGRTVLKIPLSFADLIIFLCNQSFSKWFGKCAAYPMSLSENFMYRHTSMMSSRRTMSNLFLFGCWRATIWCIGLPSTSCCAQICWSDFDIGTMTAPQVIAASCGTTKNTSICPYLVWCSFW